MTTARTTCPHCGEHITITVEKEQAYPFLFSLYSEDEKRQAMLLGFPVVLPPKSSSWGFNGGAPSVTGIMPETFEYNEAFKRTWLRQQQEAREHSTPTKVYGPTNVSQAEEENRTIPTGTGSVEGGTETVDGGTGNQLRLPDAATGQEATQETKEEGT